jgi:hypothetical protein
VTRGSLYSVFVIPYRNPRQEALIGDRQFANLIYEKFQKGIKRKVNHPHCPTYLFTEIAKSLVQIHGLIVYELNLVGYLDDNQNKWTNRTFSMRLMQHLIVLLQQKMSRNKEKCNSN